MESHNSLLGIASFAYVCKIHHVVFSGAVVKFFFALWYSIIEIKHYLSIHLFMEISVYNFLPL